MSRHLTALVIGNATYEGSSKLKNPGNDTDDVAAKLDACGFEVVKLIDCSNSDLDRALKRAPQKEQAAGNGADRGDQTGVTDMFSADPQAAPEDGRCSPEDVEAFWRNYLAVGERRVSTADFADILETTNWLPGELQSSLVRLVKAGAVRNLDADATKRRTKPLHFEKSDRLELM